MNTTFDELNQVKSFDVIFIGHLASIAASLFANSTKDAYKSLVLKTSKSIIQTSLLPLNSEQIKVTKKIKHPSIFYKDLKVASIKPVSKQIQLQGGKTYEYKYLVFSGNVQDWIDYGAIKTLQEALSNQYSRVYSNIKKRDLSPVYSSINSGNVVFYIPNGKHSGYDNFNFLYVYQKFQKAMKIMDDHVKTVNFKIILESTDFFPYCKEADQLIKRQIHDRGIQVIYNSRLTKIDYLRRTLTINETHELCYNMFYCIIPQKVPSLLQSAEVNPYFSNPKTLQNKTFRNIFIFGADIYPTTHTFQAIQYQIHTICSNLDHLLSKSGQISLYIGRTDIPIYIGSKEIVNVIHYYDRKYLKENQQEVSTSVSQKCSWLAFYTNKMVKFYLTQSYYNYGSSGSPYYIFAPNISSVKLLSEDLCDNSEPIVTGNKNFNQNMFDEGLQTPINLTADRPKNILKNSK